MGSGIVGELSFLGHSFLLGIAMVIFYDIFRIIRRVIPHKLVWISIEDLLYWCVCGGFIFFMLYRENDGIIRWFSVAGMGMGMFLYNGTISAYVTGSISWFLKKIIKLISSVIHLLCKPFCFLLKKCNKVGKHTMQKVTKQCGRRKKRLKKSIKTIKLYITKH